MAGVVAAALAAASAVAGVHQYERLAISPAGDLVAAVEMVELPGRTQQPHGVLVIRRTADGAIVSSLDPCTSCTYYDPAWSPDGATLAFAATDRTTRGSEVLLESGGQLKVAAHFDGLIAKPRWSPNGKVLAKIGRAHV